VKGGGAGGVVEACCWALERDRRAFTLAFWVLVKGRAVDRFVMVQWGRTDTAPTVHHVRKALRPYTNLRVLYQVPI